MYWNDEQCLEIVAIEYILHVKFSTYLQINLLSRKKQEEPIMKQR